ncbi:hypothetical protein LMBV_048 [Largemouth bass virus]|uniref:Uncharacterized protein n=1 Tax=Largemouth bass virus TaxID=176656 RepID=A0A9X7TVT0_9VIRU|nr:hypothetical protein OA88_22735 [Flavobacterium sp. JRM]QJE49111.1 hypothetical protein LMBV_048 [Largemouth bass virus]QJE49197.1 hypothetical protein LMBV_048 [Largemouth bass virus]
MYDARYIIRKDRGCGMEHGWTGRHKQAMGPVITHFGAHGQGMTVTLSNPRPRRHGKGSSGVKPHYRKYVVLAPLDESDNILPLESSRGVDRMRDPSHFHKDPPPGPAGLCNAKSAHPEAYRQPEPVVAGHSMSRVPVGEVHMPPMMPGESHYSGAASRPARPVEDMAKIINGKHTLPDAIAQQYMASSKMEVTGGIYVGHNMHEVLAVPTVDRLETSAGWRRNEVPFRPEHRDRTAMAVPMSERVNVAAGWRRDEMPFRPEHREHSAMSVPSGDRLKTSAGWRRDELPFRPEHREHSAMSVPMTDRLPASAVAKATSSHTIKGSVTPKSHATGTVRSKTETSSFHSVSAAPTRSLGHTMAAHGAKIDDGSHCANQHV